MGARAGAFNLANVIQVECTQESIRWMSINLDKFQVVEDGTRNFNTDHHKVTRPAKALDDLSRNFQPHPLLNVRIGWMSVIYMKFQVVEEGARIFDLDHVVGRPSSR